MEEEIKNYMFPKSVFDFAKVNFEKDGESIGYDNGFVHNGVYYTFEAEKGLPNKWWVDAYTCGIAPVRYIDT